MSFHKVQIVFDPERWEKSPNAVFALYSTYNDIAVVANEEELDKMLEEEDDEAIVDYLATITSAM